MIYVDDIQRYATPLRYKDWCHMMTDNLEDLSELHAMAEKLGIRRYFQAHPDHPHYDLIPSKRAMAIRLGAQPVDAKTLVERCSRYLRRKEGD